MKPELLAPAGSMTALIAAVKSGARAVYLGLKTHNARARATNFSTNELVEAVEYCHLRGVRIYLALNTLIADDELDNAVEAVREAYLAGIDAVIVQDIGLCARVRKQCPDLSIHASTQMNLYSKDAFKWAKKLGISRVVLPREWSIADISYAVKDCHELGIETEVFIHGAHCVSYSGICLLSAMCGSGERSGNRGNCAQTCRENCTLFFDQKRIANGPLLSVKDRYALPVMAELISTGVDCLKIEGRLREDIYVAVAVAVYRKYIDAYINDRIHTIDLENMERELLIAYNRGGSFSDLHLNPSAQTDFSAGKYVGKHGVFLGHIADKNVRRGWIKIRTDVDVFPGDILSFRNADRELLSFPVGKSEYNNDGYLRVWGGHPKHFYLLDNSICVYLTSRKREYFSILSDMDYGETTVDVEISNGDDNGQICVRVCGMNHNGKDVSVRRCFSLPSDYQGVPVREEKIIKQFMKTGLYPFRVVSVKNLIEPAAMAVSFINYMRREVYADFKNALLVGNRSCDQVADNNKRDETIDNDHYDCCDEKYVVEYIDLQSFSGQLFCGADMYVFSSADILDSEQNSRIRAFLSEIKPVYAIRMPLSGKYINICALKKETDRFVVEAEGFFEGYFSSIPTTNDSGNHITAQSNVINKSSLLALVPQNINSVSLSYEMTSDTFFKIVKDNLAFFRLCPLQLHRYGKIEWMYSSYCLLKEYGCKNIFSNKNNNECRLKIASDRSEVSVICDCDHCAMTLLGQPKWVANEEMINYFRNNGLRLLHMIRIINETEYDVMRRVKEAREKRY